MKITACSIVKNEAHNVARSIESYKDSVDEIIIVDTGSTDNTVDICKEYGAKVLFYDWNNDFAAAKNYALENAKGDWIIFLDADEWFVPKLNRQSFRKFLGNLYNSVDGLLVTLCDFSHKQQKVRVKGVTSRIFRNDPNTRFTGSIHERLINKKKKICLSKTNEIEIYHSGYADGLLKVKSKRNIIMLYELFNNGENGLDVLYYLFRENLVLDNLEEADKFYNLIMQLDNINEELQKGDNYISIYEYRYKTMVLRPELFTQNDIDEFLESVYNNYPNMPIYSYFIGIEKYKSGKYTESYKWLSQAVNLNKRYSGVYLNTFINSIFDAYNRMGNILKKQERKEDALVHYLEALRESTVEEKYIVLPQIINIIKSTPQEEIILFLNSIFDISKKENIECILKVLKCTRLHKAFLYYAIKYNKEFNGQDDTTYIAMILSGQAELAVETAGEASSNYNGINRIVDHEKQDNNKSCANNEENSCEDWHLYYAVIAILSSKRSDLYNKHKSIFKPEHEIIIEAYLNEKSICDLTDEVSSEFNRLYNTAFYILNESELSRMRKTIGIA